MEQDLVCGLKKVAGLVLFFFWLKRRTGYSLWSEEKILKLLARKTSRVQKVALMALYFSGWVKWRNIRSLAKISREIILSYPISSTKKVN